MNNRLIKSNDAGGGGGCTNTVDLYNPFPDGGGVALYQLNGDATDVSGNYDGTASNVTYGAGQFGQAGQFNGTSSYITTPHISSVSGANANFSVSFWFKLNSLTATNLIQLSGNTSNFTHFTIQVGGDGLLYLDAYGSAFNWSGLSAISANQWYNVIVVNTGATSIAYLNGLASNTLTHNLTYAGTYSTIGGRYVAGSIFTGDLTNGSIDQVRIFSRALRPYEVEALYTEEYCAPTIVPSEHFNTVTYTGNGTGQSISSLDFAPDMVWHKSRSYTQDHLLQDTIRGIGSLGGAKILYPNGTYAEATNANSSYFSSFDSNGFTVGNNAYNTTGEDYVTWNFKAGGAAVLNEQGDIDSQVSANTEAGFSIVSWTGSGIHTIGHGLNDAPKMIIVKRRSSTGIWITYHAGVDSTAPEDYYLQLNSTAARAFYTDIWQSTAPTSSIFTLYDSATSQDYIAYCFAEVEGFSNFGSYVGTGASGNTVVTGFEPAFLLVKRTDSGDNWLVFDNKRSPSAPVNLALIPNSSSAEQTGNLGNGFTFLENGFNVISTDSGVNANGGSYIYMAFAADPTTVEPSLEDSFNTVLYTGNDTNTSYTRDITGFGFQPDFVWIKDRDNGNFEHTLFDSVRGAGTSNVLSSNTTGAEGWTSAAPMSAFIDDGFSVQPRSPWNANNLVNKNGEDFVAWAWKGAELPAINSNGSIPSVVSANPAAGFSIVSYTAPASGYFKVGHGLGVKPSMVITKVRNQATYSWYTWHTGLTNETNSYLALNVTSAQNSSYTMWPYGFDTETFSHNVGFSAIASSTHIAYCFAEVAGFSKFGSYTGTGTSLNQINVGFAPRFVMIKRTNSTGGWRMYDNVRGLDRSIQAQSSDAEYDDTTNYLDFYANGFEFNNGVSYQSNPDINASGGTYIYMAFANQF